MALPAMLNSRMQLIIAGILIATGFFGQAIILFGNTGYAVAQFGWQIAAVYILAAVAILVLPWVAAHLKEVIHIPLSRAILLGFCGWITFEEHLHAANHMEMPHGAVSVASTVANHDTALIVTKFLLVLAIFAVVEILHHLGEYGVKLIYQIYEANQAKG